MLLLTKLKIERGKPIMKEAFKVLTPIEKPEDMNTLMPSQPYLVQVVNPSKNIYETNSIRGLVTAVMGEVLKDDYSRCEDLQEEELSRIEVARILRLMKLAEYPQLSIAVYDKEGYFPNDFSDPEDTEANKVKSDTIKIYVDTEKKFLKSLADASFITVMAKPEYIDNFNKAVPDLSQHCRDCRFASADNQKCELFGHKLYEALESTLAETKEDGTPQVYDPETLGNTCESYNDKEISYDAAASYVDIVTGDTISPKAILENQITHTYDEIPDNAPEFDEDGADN